VLDPLHEFVPITLDPCSNPHSIVGADVALSAPECDGLAAPWHLYTHTYVNPPYENQPEWMYKAALERIMYEAEHITMLIPASVETVGFQQLVFGTCDAICFWHKRLAFLRDGGPPIKGGNTLPSALPYWGAEPERFADHFSKHGVCVTEWR
jgi:hypothetical protein